MKVTGPGKGKGKGKGNASVWEKEKAQSIGVTIHANWLSNYAKYDCKDGSPGKGVLKKTSLWLRSLLNDSAQRARPVISFEAAIF